MAQSAQRAAWPCRRRWVDAHGRAGMSRFDDVICATSKPFAQRLTPLRYEAALLHDEAAHPASIRSSVVTRRSRPSAEDDRMQLSRAELNGGRDPAGSRPAKPRFDRARTSALRSTSRSSSCRHCATICRFSFHNRHCNSRCSIAFSRRDSARALQELSPKEKEGAGKAGCPMHPQPRTQQKKRTSVVATGSPKQSGLPCAMVLTAYSALSSATNSSCHRHLRIKGLSKPGWADAPPQT